MRLATAWPHVPVPPLHPPQPVGTRGAKTVFPEPAGLCPPGMALAGSPSCFLSAEPLLQVPPVHLVEWSPRPSQHSLGAWHCWHGLCPCLPLSPNCHCRAWLTLSVQQALQWPLAPNLSLRNLAPPSHSQAALSSSCSQLQPSFIRSHTHSLPGPYVSGKLGNRASNWLQGNEINAVSRRTLKCRLTLSLGLPELPMQGLDEQELHRGASLRQAAGGAGA